jgi:hypothetical protein
MYENNSFEHAEIQGSFRWTAAIQRRFLEVLAETGSVQRACASVSKSRKTAYALRRRSREISFVTGWDAALLIAQQSLATHLLDFAMQPISYRGYRHPETRRLMWRRTNPLLGRGQGMALLSRIDTAIAKFSFDAMRMQRAVEASHDWENFLDMVWDKQPFMCNLGRNSATMSGQEATDNFGERQP